MADYLATNTPRLRVTQTGPRGTHKMIIRFAPATSEANMISQARNICTAIKAFCVNTTSYASADIAAEGSDVFLPVAWGAAITQSTGNNAVNTTPYGCYINFVGRSTAGSRVAFYVFNLAEQYMTANNRLETAEQAIVATAIATFAGAGINTVAIDQNPFVMKSYSNTGINDRVARKSRAAV